MGPAIRDIIQGNPLNQNKERSEVRETRTIPTVATPLWTYNKQGLKNSTGLN